MGGKEGGKEGWAAIRLRKGILGPPIISMLTTAASCQRSAYPISGTDCLTGSSIARAYCRPLFEGFNASGSKRIDPRGPYLPSDALSA